MSQSTCRTGCITKDHESYAACLRDGAARVAYANSAKNQDYTAQKKWDKELDAYRAARAEGIQPEGTKMAHIEAAKRISDATGTAFQGA